MRPTLEQRFYSPHDRGSAKTERKKLSAENTVSLKGLDLKFLSVTEGEDNQSLKIKEQTANYVTPDFKQTKFLLSQLGLMYLIAGPMPDSVSANYPLTKGTRLLIKGMYETEDLAPPEITAPEIEVIEIHDEEPAEAGRDKIVVTFSGGKDSLWNLWWAINEVGRENVLAVHIAGMNRSVAGPEEEDARSQAEKLGFQLEVVSLKNGAAVDGPEVMRSRDMLIMALAAPYATAFGSSRIVMEGDFLPEYDQESQFFNSKSWAWEMFNDILANDWQLPVQVEWKNRGEMGSLEDLIKHWPEAVDLISNCFTRPYLRKPQYRKQAEFTPNFLLARGDKCCQGCIKCRKIRLAQACFADIDSSLASEVQTFLTRTEVYSRENCKKRPDFFDRSFFEHLAMGHERWDVPVSPWLAQKIA